MYLFAFAGVCMGTYWSCRYRSSRSSASRPHAYAASRIALIAAVTATVINSVNIRSSWSVHRVRDIRRDRGILVLLSLAVLIFGHHNSVSILVNTNGNGHSFRSWLPDFLGFGAFVSIWVLFTFECAGTLGEETIDAKRSAPRAVMGSYFVTMALGVVFLFCFLLAIPNVGKIAGSATPLPDIINSALPHWFSKVYLILIAWVTILAGTSSSRRWSVRCTAWRATTSCRHQKYLSRTRANGTPWIATIVVGCLTALPLIESTQLSVVLVGATAAMYSVYFSVSCILLWKRLRGWPQVSAPFKLGKWGRMADVAACIGAGAILLNLVWSRQDTNPTWKLGIPVCYWVMGIPIVLGAIYYVLVQHRRLGRTDGTAGPQRRRILNSRGVGADGHASVYEHGRADHERGTIGAEEAHHLSDLFGSRYPPDRVPAGHRPHVAFGGARRVAHRGVDVSRAHAIDADAVADMCRASARVSAATPPLLAM